MATQHRALVLGSASPRRKEILSQLGVAFRIVPSGFDETPLPRESPADHVQRLAAGKAAEVRARLGADEQRPVVLAADTIVVVDSEILGKPRDDAEAASMLARLSGRTHRVLTGLAVCEVAGEHREQRTLVTEVTFRPLGAAAITAYVASGEGRDKAGSYAIQGLGAGLVAQIQGSYTNVVGLPAVEAIDMLVSAGVIGSWP